MGTIFMHFRKKPNLLSVLLLIYILWQMATENLISALKNDNISSQREAKINREAHTRLAHAQCTLSKKLI